MAEALSERQLLDVVWRAGDLSYLLHEGQLEFRAAWHASERRVFVVNCSRRYGKSWWLCVEFVEFCITRPGALTRLGAPTAKMCRTIIEPHMRTILADCPEDMRPEYGRQDGIWRFPNGSELHLVGCDNGGHERLRGTDTDLGGLDEAGFTDELLYIVKSILLPQTITRDGQIVLASTPSKTPAHEFTTLCAEAQAQSSYIHRTIYDAPHVTEAQIEEYAIESGGKETSTWRREYLAEFVVDEDLAVVPEFSRHEAEVVFADGELEPPEHFFAYVSTDVGFHDLTVTAFGYYDFERALIVVTHEQVHERTTSRQIDEEIGAMEVELWGEEPTAYGETRPAPHLRVVDAPPIVVAEMCQGGRSWVQSRKDDKEAAVNALRMTIPHGLRIHERCTTIRAHLRHAIWNRARTKFERSGGFGHFDGVDAMVYLVRNVDRSRNPFPQLPAGVTHENHHIPPELRESRSREAEALRAIFRRRGRRG